jgi:hypothetical protein
LKGAPEGAGVAIPRAAGDFVDAHMEILELTNRPKAALPTSNFLKGDIG